jgi:hypothetical protein
MKQEKEKKERSNKSPARSIRLRRYKDVYESCLKKTDVKKAPPRKERRDRTKNRRSPKIEAKDSNTQIKSAKDMRKDRKDMRKDRKDIHKKEVSELSELSDIPESIPSTPKRVRKPRVKKVKEDQTKGKKPLTEYQKFVKSRSKAPKYKNTSPKSRMRGIGKEWKVKSTK